MGSLDSRDSGLRACTPESSEAPLPHQAVARSAQTEDRDSNPGEVLASVDPERLAHPRRSHFRCHVPVGGPDCRHQLRARPHAGQISADHRFRHRSLEQALPRQVPEPGPSWRPHEAVAQNQSREPGRRLGREPDGDRPREGLAEQEERALVREAREALPSDLQMPAVVKRLIARIRHGLDFELSRRFPREPPEEVPGTVEAW